VRPNGVEVVLLGNGTAYANGRILDGVHGEVSFAANDDGSAVYAGDPFANPYGPVVTHWSLDYSDMSGGVLLATSVSTYDMGRPDGWADFAFAPDGGALYMAFDSDRCVQVNPLDMKQIAELPGGALLTTGVETTRSGRVLCASSWA